GVGGVIWMLASVLHHVHVTAGIIIFSILFAYAVYPPIKLIARRGVPVALAALIVYVVLGALVLGAVAWLTPAIATEVEALSHEFPSIVANAQKQIADP